MQPVDEPAAGTEYEFPVAPVQARLLVLEELRPGGSEYHVPVAFAVTGPLSVTALRRAVRALVDRHEALRTSFRPERDGYVQLVSGAADIEITVGDASAGQVDALLAAEAARPFDLRRAPLLHCAVYRVDDGDWRVLLTVHHLVCDGWSLRIMLDELGALYAGTTPAALPVPAVQYPDYTSWLHDRVADGTIDPAIEYFVRSLDGAPRLFDLPTDRPRPAVQTNRGAAQVVRLTEGTRRRVDTVARESGVTAHTVLLAAFYALLARICGRRDLVVGVPVAGRDHPDLERVVGMFVNMIALRVDVPARLDFRALVDRVGKAMAAARPHQDAPFDAVVAALAVDRTLSYDPLVQAVFAYEDDTETRLELTGTRTTRVPLPPVTAKFDLSVAIARERDGLTVEFDYRTDLFTVGTMSCWAAAFSTLLAGLLDRPDQPVDDADLVDSMERTRLLCATEATPRPVPARTVPDLIAARATERPDALALVSGDLRLTYRDLLTRADRLAGWLRRAGVGADVPVGLCFPRGAELPIAVLAVLRAGGAFVPFEADQPALRLRSMIADSAAALVLTTRATAALAANAGPPVVVLRAGADALPDPVGDLPPHPQPAPAPLPGHLAYLLYTSGSTGTPKAVAVEHRSLTNLALSVRHDVALTADDRVLQYVSFGFDVTVADMLITWSAGAELHIAGEHERLADTLLARLRDSRISYAFLPPVAAMSLPHTEQARADLAGLRVLCVGGEAFPPVLAQRWGGPDRALLNAYGPTETTVYATVARVGAGAPVPIGRPVANTAVRVLDNRLRLVPVGVVGEIYLAGAGLARGYFRRPGLTATRFVADPTGQPGSRMYRTGDLARVEADGTVHYLGRADHQVKLRGFRVELGEIETVLAGHPGVRAAVATLTRSPEDPRLIGYAVPAGPPLPAEGALRGWLRDRLPHHMVPDRIVALAELPLLPSGKVDRGRLPEPPAANAGTAEPGTPPRTPTERRLAQVWSQVLHTNGIGRYDNFFDLGGDSVRMLAVLTALRGADEPPSGRELSLVDLFAHPNIAALGEFLDRPADGMTDGRDVGRLRGGDRRARLAARQATATPLPDDATSQVEGDNHD